MKIYDMKIISNLSIIFAIVNFLLCLIDQVPINQYMFFCIGIFSFLLYLRKPINKYVKIAMEIILILPVLFIKGNMTKLAVVVIYGMIIYLHKQKGDSVSYIEIADQFKKGFTVSIVIAIIGRLSLNGYKLNDFILPYIILYMISTIIMLRYLRNYEHNAINEKMNKINIVYSIIILVSAFIFALKPVRNAIFNGIFTIYTLIVEAIMYVFMKILYLFSGFFNNLHFNIKNPNNPSILVQQSPNHVEKYKTHMGLLESNPLLYKIIVIVINITLLLIVLYFLTKMLGKKFSSKSKKEEFIETKEFILPEKHSNRLMNKLSDFFMKKDCSYQIRHYYKKFMNDSINKGILLKESDTTMDIYSKSKQAFKQTSLWNMRNIYLQARYTDKKSTKVQLNEFYKFYKDKKI